MQLERALHIYGIFIYNRIDTVVAKYKQYSVVFQFISFSKLDYKSQMAHEDYKNAVPEVAVQFGHRVYHRTFSFISAYFAMFVVLV